MNTLLISINNLTSATAASSELVILLLELEETDTTFVGGVITTDGE